MSLLGRVAPGIMVGGSGAVAPHVPALIEQLMIEMGGKPAEAPIDPNVVHLLTVLSPMLVILGVVTVVGGGFKYLFDVQRGYGGGIFFDRVRHVVYEPEPVTEKPRPEPVKAAPAPKPEPTPPAPVTGRNAVVAEWQHALEKHLVVKDAYAAIICDPLNVLNHSSLFDVANAKTASWLVAFNECQDLLFIHAPDEEAPEDPAIVTKYAAAVRAMTPLWDAALWYAEKTGTDWLPAEEKQSARRAARLLEKAANDAATESERALSLDKAADLLASIRSFKMPKEARAVMAGASRKVIEARRA